MVAGQHWVCGEGWEKVAGQHAGSGAVEVGRGQH